MTPETAKDALIEALVRAADHEIATEDGDTITRDGECGWPCECGYWQPMRDDESEQEAEWKAHESLAALDALLEHREELLVAMGGRRYEGTGLWFFPVLSSRLPRVSESVPQPPAEKP